MVKNRRSQFVDNWEMAVRVSCRSREMDKMSQYDIGEHK